MLCESMHVCSSYYLVLHMQDLCCCSWMFTKLDADYVVVSCN
jgi:hypothetical protein